MADETETVIEVPAEAPLVEAVVAEPVVAEAAPEAIAPVEAAAVEAAPPVEVAAVEFPARAKRGPKPRVEAPAPVAAPVAVVAAPAKLRKAKAAPKKRAASVKKIQAATKTAPKKTVSQKIPNPISQLKDTIMASKQTQDFTEGFKNVVGDVQAKAKEAFEKSTSAFGEVNEFAKGNVEAIVESGKLLGAGLQELGTSYAAEAKTAFETLTADVKEIATAKNPTDFFKLQGELMRRNFDSVVALSSKNSEAMMKLATDAFAPLSGRVSLAVAKVKSAA